jgi:hypothetical protein
MANTATLHAPARHVVPRLRRVSSDDVLDRAREDVAVVGKTRREGPVDAAQRTRTKNN